MIQPVANKLIILPIPKKEETMESGIIIPESANADLREGKVVAVSRQIENLYPIGSIILYPGKKGVGEIINNLPHLWLDSTPEKEEIWGLVTG